MFFDLHDGGECTVLVQIAIDGGRHEPDLGEFIELVRSAGGDPASIIRGSRRAPMAKYFIGQGKLDEIKEEVDRVEADLVVFNHVLSPSQERNLEAYLCCRVIARTGLILDIFAQRARTHEGKLQVELAQLKLIEDCFASVSARLSLASTRCASNVHKIGGHESGQRFRWCR
jgi:GTP-binding protein HflX